jgi:Transglutaminase-like superfamily
VGFIHLASDVLFDATNEEGQLLHTATGTCLALDPLATLFLQIALNQESKASTLAALGTRVEATDAQLEEALASVLDHLLTLGFLSTIPSAASWTTEARPLPVFAADVLTVPNQPPLSRQSRVDWEFFLTGRVVNSPLPRVSLLKKGDAFWKTGTLVLSMGSTHLLATLCDLLGWHMRAQQIRQHEWELLAQRLSRMGGSWSDMEADLLWRLARRELVWCQMLVRSLAPTGVCLVRSIAFCTYLRALGLPAILVIARACFDLSGHAPFHAWVELAGFVVNDHAELQSGYRVIQRLPFQEEREQEPSTRMNSSHIPQ